MNEDLLEELAGRYQEIVGVSNIVTHINMKLLESVEDEKVRKVYSDLLNDIKLMSMSAGSVH